jgi:hypothetical protein
MSQPGEQKKRMSRMPLAKLTSDAAKFCIGPAPYFNVGFVRSVAPFLLSILLLTGCSTVTTYKPNTAAGPAKPVGYPIPVYTEDMTVPRPCEVIGTVSIGGGRFTMFGGSAESEMLKVMRTAREKGADAVQMKSHEEPGFSNLYYRLVADLLRYTDNWETVAISGEWFANYLKANRRNLDPIEGVWDAYGSFPHRVGIMRNTSKPGRDYVAFILDTRNPSWRVRYKKIDIQRATQPGIYLFDYYLDNFSKRATTVVLSKGITFTLVIPMTDDEADIITYSKER